MRNRTSQHATTRGRRYAVLTIVGMLGACADTDQLLIVLGTLSEVAARVEASEDDEADPDAGGGAGADRGPRSQPRTEPASRRPTPAARTPVIIDAGGATTFSCSFETSPTDCGFREQAYAPGRATLVNIGRDGSRAVRLLTLPTDTNVAGSVNAVRNDLVLTQAQTGCYQGQEQWWAHSVLFPDDFVVPSDGWGVVLDFHQTGAGGGSTGQANFHVDTSRWDGHLHLRGYGGRPGTPRNSDRYQVRLGPIARNVWYDFVYHVRWSSARDGFMQAWLNGEMVLDHRGPTLYTGQGCYLKLANYHSQVGAPSAVVHDRIRRGTSASAVALGPLENVVPP